MHIQRARNAGGRCRLRSRRVEAFWIRSGLLAHRQSPPLTLGCAARPLRQVLTRNSRIRRRNRAGRCVHYQGRRRSRRRRVHARPAVQPDLRAGLLILHGAVCMGRARVHALTPWTPLSRARTRAVRARPHHSSALSLCVSVWQERLRGGRDFSPRELSSAVNWAQSALRGIEQLSKAEAPAELSLSQAFFLAHPPSCMGLCACARAPYHGQRQRRMFARRFSYCSDICVDSHVVLQSCVDYSSVHVFLVSASILVNTRSRERARGLSVKTQA